MNVPVESTCCLAWKEAIEHGSDCERNDRCAYVAEFDSVNDYEHYKEGDWLICGVQQRVKFCPWCGAPK